MSVQLTRLEVFIENLGDWIVVEESVGLLHPDRYPERLAARGKVGRATVLSTKQVFQVLPEPKLLPMCSLCEERHEPPFDGMCLL